MIKKMLTRGTVMVVSLIAAQKVIAKLEKESLKRDDKSKKKDSEKKDEITDEERFGEILKEHGFQEMEVVN